MCLCLPVERYIENTVCLSFFFGIIQSSKRTTGNGHPDPNKKAKGRKGAVEGNGEKAKTKTQGTQGKQSGRERDFANKGEAALEYPAMVGDSQSLHADSSTTVLGAITRDKVNAIGANDTQTIVFIEARPVNITVAGALARVKCMQVQTIVFCGYFQAGGFKPPLEPLKATGFCPRSLPRGMQQELNAEPAVRAESAKRLLGGLAPFRVMRRRVQRPTLRLIQVWRI